MAEKLNKSVSTCLGDTAHRRIRELAAAEGRAVSAVLRRLVETGLETLAASGARCVIERCARPAIAAPCDDCGLLVTRCQVGHAFETVVEGHECEACEDLEDEAADDEGA